MRERAPAARLAILAWHHHRVRASLEKSSLDCFRTGTRQPNPSLSLQSRPQTINNAASVVGLYDDLCPKEYPMLRCVCAGEGWKHFAFVAAEKGSTLLGAQRQQRTSSIIILLVGAGDADADNEEPSEVALAM
jgi:hypothetical protein